MLAMAEQTQLSRRGRQIMDIVYARRHATVTDVIHGLPDPPSRTAIRTLLGILEKRGYVKKHGKRGREIVYRPVQPRKHAGQSAMRRLVKTFFEGSLPEALAAHLADPRAGVSAEELKRLSELIRKARKGE